MTFFSRPPPVLPQPPLFPEIIKLNKTCFGQSKRINQAITLNGHRRPLPPPPLFYVCMYHSYLSQLLYLFIFGRKEGGEGRVGLMYVLYSSYIGHAKCYVWYVQDIHIRTYIVYSTLYITQLINQSRECETCQNAAQLDAYIPECAFSFFRQANERAGAGFWKVYARNLRIRYRERKKNSGWGEGGKI